MRNGPTMSIGTKTTVLWQIFVWQLDYKMFLRILTCSTVQKNLGETMVDNFIGSRRIAHLHHAFNITTYTPLWNIADQYDIMWPQTMQDLLISIGILFIVQSTFSSGYGPNCPAIHTSTTMFDRHCC